MPKNIYKLKDETIVPGVTTVCNQLDKPQLLDWAWRLGKEGKDWREQRDSAGDIGTLVHQMVLDFWLGKAVNRDDATVAKCFQSFLKWVNEEKIMPLPIVVEIQLVSEKLKFGGQPDALLKINGKYRLQDVKTGNGIYENYWYQLAGYDILLEENGYKVDEYQILRIGKDGSLEAPIRTELKREKRIFKHLLAIYYDRREL